MDLPDPTTRFSDRVEDYVRYRPGYPREVVEALEEEAGLHPGAAVADVGAGTGIFSALLLERGAEVFAVEPNDAMRAAAESALGADPRFHSIAATAEETTLAAGSVDLVVAAQAFHWFDLDRARAEFGRILKPGAPVAIVWNRRRDRSSPFLEGYERLLHRFGTDYAQVDHRQVDALALLRFFGGSFEARSFPSSQTLDRDGVRGRLLSSSYAPPAGHPDHLPMLAALDRLLDEHAGDGTVSIDYDTQLYFGTPAR
jgi:SAM-dependent methyltransferase